MRFETKKKVCKQTTGFDIFKQYVIVMDWNADDKMECKNLMVNNPQKERASLLSASLNVHLHFLIKWNLLSLPRHLPL